MSQEKEAEDEKLTRPQCTDAVPNPMQLASLLHSTGAQGDVEAFVGSEHVMPTVEGFAEYRNLVTMFEECASAVTYSDYDDFRISVYKSAALFALPKPDDSPRPIVCASVFSRCFANLACASFRPSVARDPTSQHTGSSTTALHPCSTITVPQAAEMALSLPRPSAFLVLRYADDDFLLCSLGLLRL